MNCRGKSKRIQIVKNYFVEPLAHIKLLNGVTIESDAGGDIVDTYYIFKCKNKNTNVERFICCGTPTAKHLCELTGNNLPPLFNPLKQTHITNSITNNKTSKGVNLAWNPMRKQLYNATMLLISKWNAKPNTPLFFIKSELELYPNYEPLLKYIKSINTILKNSGNTMMGIINELKENNNLKDFEFDLLINTLKKYNIEQYFE